MERMGRDFYKYIEGDHSVLVQVELQGGNPDYIIYSASISQWLPPYENDKVTDADRSRILQKVGRFIEYYGETYAVR
jgi:hypothetical protein